MNTGSAAAWLTRRASIRERILKRPVLHEVIPPQTEAVRVAALELGMFLVPESGSSGP